MKILVTGASGFIAGYLIADLLEHGYDVVGVDNHSKYGRVEKSYSSHPRYRLVEADVKDVPLMKSLLTECDHFVAGAAMIGGISYFHEFAYDLLSENERIMAASFDAAIDAHKNGRLRKVTVISSSMVFESAETFPSREGDQFRIPPPRSTYGFQKLACEYYARGALEQYGLPFTLCRPFNCVGIGEARAKTGKTIMSGNVSLAMSHVVPDIAQKLLRGQDPLHILGGGNQIRHYTYGGDLARGIRLAIESPLAENEDFNLSSPVGHTVLELAESIWRRLNPNKPFRYVSDKPFEHDVQRRVPDVAKAKGVLGFEASTTLDEMLDEVLPWIRTQVELGAI